MLDISVNPWTRHSSGMLQAVTDVRLQFTTNHGHSVGEQRRDSCNARLTNVCQRKRAEIPDRFAPFSASQRARSPTGPDVVAVLYRVALAADCACCPT